MKVQILNYLFLFTLCVQPTHSLLANENAKDAYERIAVNFLTKKQYAYNYAIYLVGTNGEQVEYFDENSIMIRDNLTLFTHTKKMDYILNTEGSLIVNHSNKKIQLSFETYSDKEKSAFEKSLDEQMVQKIKQLIDICDSVSVSELNGYTIYTTYATNNPFRKAECWITPAQEIKEVRYFFSEGEFAYQRIVYNKTKIDDYKKELLFSNYIVKQKDKYTPTSKYKDYEIVLGN